jgi:peptide/nickel transport system ATP-binding protein
MIQSPRLSVRNGTVTYKDRDGVPFNALDGVSFDVLPGQTLGIVGESGCGKSSLAKLIAKLTPLFQGTVRLDGERIDHYGVKQWKPLRRRLQYVFQDPLGALDPRMSIMKQVREPLDIHNIGTKRERERRAIELMDAVGIGKHLYKNSPVEISGGQRQRVVLARALVLQPEVLLCDEPVSALDVSIQAQVLSLLTELRDRLGLTMVFISHDLTVVRHVSHQVAVMYLGRFVEMGEIDQVFHKPAHPYTRALLDALPRLGGQNSRIRLKGETPSPRSRPAGCGFAPRCPAVIQVCREKDPSLISLVEGRFVACHSPFATEA